MINETATSLTQFATTYTSIFGSLGTVAVLAIIPMILILGRGFGTMKTILFFTIMVTSLQYLGVIEMGNWVWLVWGICGLSLTYNIINHSIHSSQYIPKPSTLETKKSIIYILSLLGLTKIKKPISKGESQ